MKQKIQIGVRAISLFARNIIAYSRTSSILLIIFTLMSLVLANSEDTYVDFWKMTFISLEKFHLPNSPLLIVNDLLMPLFFFTVGYEIRHELFSPTGSINTPQKATLPLFAAFGGIIMPAILFAFINKGTPYIHGWAIPTATDIAFSLAIVSILGKAIPNAVKIFLMALAVFDDMIAILIIALFYGSSVQWAYLICTTILCSLIYLLNRIKKPSLMLEWIQIPMYIILWYFIHWSGIHPTISGILIAFIISNKLAEKGFKKLYKIVEFLILPLFVLANTAIPINSEATTYLLSSLSVGIIIGLVIGKPLGITLITILANKLKISTLAQGVKLKHIIGVGFIAGVGFTMSIFIANLSFDKHFLIDVAKLATIIASLIAGFTGVIFIKLTTKKK